MDYRIEDLPESERPREKLEENGVESLSEVELLSLIIRSGVSGKNVKELSGQILSSYSFSQLKDIRLEELEQIRGISRVKSGQLKAVSELATRMQREERERLESFSDACSMLEDMKYLSEERLRAVFLSGSNEVIDEAEFEGEPGSVSFSARDLLREAVSRGAAGMILAHNHPSGKAEPTEKDIETTRSLIESCENLGISLLDHLIVGETTASMREETELEFG